MQQGKKLAGKYFGFLTKTCSQAQAYLGIPQTFFGSSRQGTTNIEDAPTQRRCWPERRGVGWKWEALCG